MSDQETAFIQQLKEDREEFKDDFDRRYTKMVTFLLSILTVFLSAGLIVGFTHFTRDGVTRTRVATMQENQKEILKQAVSKDAIDKLILTFDRQSEIMERFLPNDLQGAIREFNKTSSDFRRSVMQGQTGIILSGGNGDNAGKE